MTSGTLTLSPPTGRRSSRVNGGFLPLAISQARALVVVVESMPRVYPSGGDWATAVMPNIVEAPALFTTTKGWPNTFSATVAKARAPTSCPPPGALGLMRVTALVGYSAAGDKWTRDRIEMKTTNTTRVLLFMAP